MNTVRFGCRYGDVGVFVLGACMWYGRLRSPARLGLERELNGLLADPSGTPNYRVTHSTVRGMNHRLTDIT